MRNKLRMEVDNKKSKWFQHQIKYKENVSQYLLTFLLFFCLFDIHLG